MDNKNTFAIKCRGVIIANGKLLVVAHSHNPALTALPGGHLDFGEDPKECLVRELEEELGVLPEVGDLIYVNTYTDKRHLVEFFFLINNPKDYLNLDNQNATHAHELAEILWLSPEEIKAKGIVLRPEKFAYDFQNNNLVLEKTKFIKD